MKQVFYSLIVLLTSSTIASADVVGVWSTKEGCDWYINGNLDNEDVSIISERGIEGMEWGCNFNSVSVNAEGQTVYDSTCYIEDQTWQDNVTVETNFDTGGYTAIFSQDDEVPVRLEFPLSCE